MRTDAILASLTEDQLDQVYDWIATEGCASAQRRMLEPAPAGFALRVSITSLRRFFHTERRRRQIESLLQARATHALATDPSALLDEMKINLAEAAFDLTQDSATPQLLNTVSRHLHRLETLTLKKQAAQIAQQRAELEQKRLELETRKFEYDALVAASKHARELVAILDDQTATDLEKFTRARPILFAPGANNQPSIDNPPTLHTHALPTP